MEKRLSGMREQSHIDAMREAVRGDLERARERRPSIFERPAAPPEPEPEPLVAELPEPEPRRSRWAFWRR